MRWLIQRHGWFRRLLKYAEIIRHWTDRAQSR